MDAFEELWGLDHEAIDARNALVDRISASGKGPEEFIGEWEDVLAAFRDGAYKFVTEGNLPRFSEVREINDRISTFVEARVRQRELYIRSLKTGNNELYDESQALRFENNKEWRAIKDMASDLNRKWFS